ncbi:site-specific integrase [Amycolatopsis keratiniphila]|uniref:site-specific integrase n=1 Tax=Amycolatopsis keratiniphila TaxID=129921 RepID=UPI0033DAE053
MGQVRALRISAERYPGPARRRYRAAVAVLTSTGIRAEELCALNRRDLHPAGPDGTPALWIDGMGRKRRWVKLPGMAVELLEDYLTERDAATAQVPMLSGQVSAKPAEQPLFTTATGSRLGAQQVTDMLRYLCRHLVRAAAAARSSTLRGHAAQLRPIKDTIHSHSTRHFYAITAENNGVPIRQISTKPNTGEPGAADSTARRHERTCRTGQTQGSADTVEDVGGERSGLDAVLAESDVRGYRFGGGGTLACQVRSLAELSAG